MKDIAAMFVEATRSGRPFELPAGVRIANDRESYRVQDAVFAALWPGVRAAAWKAGGPSDTVEPTAAPIPPQRLLQSPARVAAAAMNFIGLEAEVAFRLAQDLPQRARPYSDEEIGAAIGEALVTIELCSTRLADWKGAPAAWKLADFQNNGVLVAGTGTREWRAVDFLKQEVRLGIGARTLAFRGTHPFGNPFRLMPWIVAHCAQRTGGLRKGELVTTGSWTGLELARAGEEARAVFPGIGEARARID